jgi:hypothetical protein
LLVLLAASALAEDALTTGPVIQGSPVAIGIDAAGNRYVAGTFGGSVDFNPGVGEDSRTSTSFKDLFVTRFNADGSYGWTQALGNIGYNNAAAVVASNNVIYVAGWLENFDFGIIQPEPPIPLLNTAVLEPAPPVRINPPPATPPSSLFASLPSNVSIAYVLALDAASGAPLTTFGNGGIMTYSAGSGATAKALALSGNVLYLGGSANFSPQSSGTGSIIADNQSLPIVVALAADSGALVSIFGVGGVFTSGTQGGSVNGLALSGSTLYAAGTLGSPFDFGISVANPGGPLEQAFIFSLNASSGAFNSGFGSGGVQLFGDPVNQLTTANAIAVSGATVYLCGSAGPNTPAQPIALGGTGTVSSPLPPSPPPPVKAYAAAFDAATGAAIPGFGTLGVATFGRQFGCTANALVCANGAVFVAGDYGDSYELGGFPIFYAAAGSGPKGGVFAAAPAGAGANTADAGRRPSTPTTAINAAPSGGSLKGLVFRPQVKKVTGIVQAQGPAAKYVKKSKHSKKNAGPVGANNNISPAGGTVANGGAGVASSAGFAFPIFFGGAGSFVDAFVLALDAASGQPLTAFSGDGFETFGGSLDDHGNALAYFNGKFFLAGDFYSTDAGVGGLGTIDSTHWNGYLLQLDAAAGGGGGVETNRAPVVSAGVNHDVRVPQFNDPDYGPDFPMYDFLMGSVNDDGLPNPPGSASVQWTQISGPASAMLDSPNTATTSVNYSQAGQYVFSLTASDGVLSASGSVTINVSVNHAPEIHSPPTVTPAHPLAGKPVTFSIAAGDKDNDELFYAWDFGDGNFDFDASVTHTYDSGGKYLVIVDVDDGWDIVERSFVLQVGDGPPGSLPIEVSALAFKVNFGKSAGSGKDSCELTGSLGALPADFNPTGAVVALNLNSVSSSFTLDSNGAAKSAAGTFSLSRKNNAWLFSARLQGSFSAQWGLSNETDTQACYVMPVTLTINGVDYTTSKSVKYSSRAKRGGAGRD